MSKEVFDELDIIGDKRHQIARAAAHQVGRRQRIELAEDVEPHLGQQPERHVMSNPGFQPVQDAGQRSKYRQRPQPAAVILAVLEIRDSQRAQHANADEGQNAQHAEQEGQCQATFPGEDDAHQVGDHLIPANAVGLEDAFGHGFGCCPFRQRLDRTRNGQQVMLGATGLAHLFRHQGGVDATLAQQRVMRAALGHAAIVQHQDAIAADDAGKPVGEDERGAALHQPVEGRLDRCLILGIDRGESFIEHQNRRIAQQCAGDGDALALSARQLDALFADDRVIALRQRLDEVVDVGSTRRILDMGAGGIGPAHADIFLDRAVKQERVLVDDGDHAADLLGSEIPEIVAADLDAALLWVIETQQQPHDRRFAAAGTADQTDALAGCNGEI